MTPIPARLRQGIYDRDQGLCQACGRHCLHGPHSLQHRRPRQMGGDRSANTPENLVLLCGTGTTGCHGYYESKRELAHVRGWLVHRWESPGDRPVLRFGRNWSIPTATEWLPALAPEEMSA